MTSVTFNYAIWSGRFPELAPKVTEDQAQSYWDEAAFAFIDPDSDCPIACARDRAMLLGLIVAHIAYCRGASAASAAGLVGRISNVTEGSVTIGTEFKSYTGDQEAYFGQSPYGVQYWAMTAGYRTMHYVPGLPTENDLLRAIGPSIGLGGMGTRWG